MMEEPAGSIYHDGLQTTVRKKRSQSCRRRRPDSNVAFAESHNDNSLLMSSGPSDDFSDDIPAFDTNLKRKVSSLSHCIEKDASVSKFQKDDIDSRRNRLNDNRRSTEGVLAPANWRNASQDGDIYDGKNGHSLDLSESVKEGKVKKVKLKVCGRTHTITANGGTRDGSGRKAYGASDDSRTRGKQNLEGDSDDCNFSQDKKMGSVPKSKRATKRWVLDGEFSEEDDDEIRYLEKLKSRSFKEEGGELGMKQPSTSRVSNAENVVGKRKSRLDKASEDVEDDELVGSPVVNDRKVTLTRRQRALQSSKDVSASASGSSIVEFPDGLPLAPSRKKQKLSDVEQQLKKAEAIQRRRLQTEKAAKESEVEAIKKILGQDSNRKKREDKIRKRHQELAREKAAHEQMAASSCIRIIMGPDRTTVTFPENIGLPSLFNLSIRYPPPREKCAEPSCNNPYKYRDSKTKLPLCSLQCYKAVQEGVQSETISPY